MTRDQMRDLVVEHTRRSDKQSLIERSIALAVAEIGQLQEWRELRYEYDLTIALDERFVNLQPGTFHVMGIRLIDADAGYWPVELWSKSYVVERYPDEGQSSTGKPLMAYEDTGQLWFLPKSDAQYIVRIDCFRLHPELSSSDQPLIQAIDNAIVAWATQYVFKSIQLYDDSAMWMQEYSRAMSIAIRAERRTQFKKVLERVEGNEVRAMVEPWRDPFAKR